jgi:hypothetical protein
VKANYKFGAISFFSFSHYRSNVPLNYLLAKRQANPVSFIFILGMKPFKSGKYFFCIKKVQPDTM